jgi:hypothetical protein
VLANGARSCGGAGNTIAVQCTMRLARFVALASRVVRAYSALRSPLLPHSSGTDAARPGAARRARASPRRNASYGHCGRRAAAHLRAARERHRRGAAAIVAARGPGRQLWPRHRDTRRRRRAAASCARFGLAWLARGCTFSARRAPLPDADERAAAAAKPGASAAAAATIAEPLPAVPIAAAATTATKPAAAQPQASAATEPAAA